MTSEPRELGIVIVYDLILEYYADKFKTVKVKRRDGVEYWRRGGVGDLALVYGQMTRYSKMFRRECFESIEVMAEQIGMARSTFRSHLAELVVDRWVAQTHASDGGRNQRSKYRTFHSVLYWLEYDLFKKETLRSTEGHQRY